jgi:hypothetical protein
LTVYLWRVFSVKPFAAVSVLVSLATILALFALQRRRPQQKADRFLIGFLGFLSVYQGMRIMQSVGVLYLPPHNFDDLIELLVTCMYLVAALLVRVTVVNHLDAESAMRLARAAPPRTSAPPEPVRRENPVLDTLTWALPRLSDGAFRLYAFLCLRSDDTNGRMTVGSQDVQMQLGKAKVELEDHLAELQSAGAVTVRREGQRVEIEINYKDRKTAATPPQPYLAAPVRAVPGPYRAG